MSNPWDNLHKHYQKQDWIDKANIFATEAIKHFPGNAKILELGAGQGQDSRYFAEAGFEVVSTDISTEALVSSKNKLPDDLKGRIKTTKIDMTKPLPYTDESYDKDPEYGQGEQIEIDYFFIEDKNKRFFSTESIKDYFKNFEITLLDDEGETYKDAAKGVHNLIRFIAKKN